MQYAINAHEKGTLFHYSWFLLLISFIAWSNPQDYQGLNLLVTCKGVRYHNLWFEKYLKDRQKHNNIEFFMHGEAIRHQVNNMSRLDDDTIQQFRSIVKFEIGLHDTYIYPRQQLQGQRLQTKFIMSKEEI